MDKQQLLQKIDDLNTTMPWYIQDYVRSKKTSLRADRTIYEYLKEYRRFLEWLRLDNYIEVEAISDIDYRELENLPKRKIEDYFIIIRDKKFNPETNCYEERKERLSERTIQRTRAALVSLFNYLTTEIEMDSGEALFDRNVMNKVKFTSRRETLQARAASIAPRLFLGDETQQFLDYITYRYAGTLNPRALVSFEKNKERDLAICAFILATGLRLNEVVTTDLKNLNLKTMQVDITRKGGVKDTVNIAPFAKNYLEDYLNIRKERYHTTDEDKALFVTTTSRSGSPKRLQRKGIEDLVAKYSEGFKIRVTPHKLRHTLATRLYEATKSQVLVSQQLGHASTQITDLYVHINENEQREAIKNL